MKLRPRDTQTIEHNNSDLGSLRDNIHIAENSSVHESIGMFNAAAAVTDYTTLQPLQNRAFGKYK